MGISGVRVIDWDEIQKLDIRSGWGRRKMEELSAPLCGETPGNGLVDVVLRRSCSSMMITSVSKISCFECHRAISSV